MRPIKALVTGGFGLILIVALSIWLVVAGISLFVLALPSMQAFTVANAAATVVFVVHILRTA